MRKLSMILTICLTVFLLTACANSTEGYNTVTLVSGVNIQTITAFNSAGLEAVDTTGWFGADSELEADKLDEMNAIMAVMGATENPDIKGFVVEEDAISWYWGVSDTVPSLSLSKDAENQFYLLDVNYNMRDCINATDRTDVESAGDVLTTENGRDIMLWMLSFVSADPVTLESQMYHDCFINETPAINPTDWVTVADCDVKYNADSGYGVTFVIRQHEGN